MKELKPSTVKVITALLFLYIMIGAVSCFHYYKVAKTNAVYDTPANVVAANPERYFILRSGASAFYMRDIVLSSDKKSLTCKLEDLPEQHTLHLHKGRHHRMIYKAMKPEAVVLNEIHLYVQPDSSARAEKSYTLLLADIQKIEVLEKDQASTTTSYILGGLGITAGVFVAALVIIAATKSSCPFVSAYDGADNKFQGEIYGGAIYPQMARDDYMELQMKPTAAGNLQVTISNELKERQYTDFTELSVITHDKNVQILVDETGKPYSIAKPIAPIAAKAGETDILPLLREKNDDKYYSFDDTSASTGVNQIQLSFARPLNAKKAKLILRLKNSYWMDATYGKMTEGFGSYYNAFIQQQHSKPLSELKKWISDQQIPLEVALNTKTGLQHITDIATFGPLASRSIVVPIDLTNVNSDEIQLQLSTGFMFWELDYAAIDFSEEAGFSISTLKPAMATDETGRNVTGLLTAADGKYLEQPNIGNSVNIEFVPDKHKDRRKIETYILHAKGYYEHIRDYRTPLNLGFLEQFKKPNGLSRYSMQLYKAALNNPKQLFFSMR